MSLCALIQTLIYVYHVSGYFLLPSPVYLASFNYIATTGHCTPSESPFIPQEQLTLIL